MRNKKILFIVIISISILSGNRFEYLAEVTPDIIKSTKRFENLNDNIANVDRFIHLSKKFETIDEKILNSITQYKGDEYLTKNEYKKVATNVLNARKNMKENLVSNYILYLTSESVPDRAYANVLHSVGILQENGYKIKSKQYLYGIPEDFKSFMFNKKDYFNSLPEKERGYILPNFGLKLDPRIFDTFKVTHVPAIIFATCSGNKPSPQTCIYKHIIRGDVSLITFFDKIKEKDSRYENYHNALLHNKINGDKNE